MSTQAPTGAYVQSLARGLEVISAFDAEHQRMSLSEVAEATDMSRAAARRFLLTLQQLGYVRAEGRQFALTPRVLELGASYLSGLGLPEVAQPHLERLTGQLGESCSAAVLDGQDIVYVARSTARRIMAVGINVGTRFPAVATAMGRVLLASLTAAELKDWLADADLSVPGRPGLDEAGLRELLSGVRAHGYAANDEELARGLRSLAAPVQDRSGRVVAAINVATSTAHDPRAEYLDALLGTARAISDDLGAMR